MTICIAAIGGNDKFVVVASDRMVTASPPPIEFEHNACKITEVSQHSLVLTAGDALAHVELCNEAINMVTAIRVLSVRQIAGEIQSAYVKQRTEKVEAEYLRPRGWDIKRFYEELAGRVPPEITFTVDRQITAYEHDLSVIVAGVDEKAHVYSIRNPGALDCWDGMGCFAVGSGSSHAMPSFFLNNWQPSISLGSLVFMTYEAKRRAEVAPGVGKVTDMAYITKAGITYLTPDHLKRLEELWSQKNTPISGEFEKDIQSLFKDKGDKKIGGSNDGGREKP